MKLYKLEEINSQTVSVEIEQILNQEITDSKRNLLESVFQSIDLTSLSGTDNKASIDGLCKKAIDFKNAGHQVAAVCVYPNFVSQAKKTLLGTDVKIACVAGAFPSGQSPLEIRKAEVEYAIQQGVDEVDMVISRGRMKEGDYDFVYKEVKTLKKACGDKHLKVILETGELQNLALVKLASEIAIDAGADFIKTSTGKVEPAATLEAFYVMLLVIKHHFEKTGKIIGIKPAGGIADPDIAIQYLSLLKSVLGDTWQSSDYFRIGASRLAGKVLSLLNQE